MTLTHTLNSIEWAKVDLKKVPHIISEEVPGPMSRDMHQRAAAIMKGYSSQVTLFPVVFEKGHGCTLTDVDGSTWIFPLGSMWLPWVTVIRK